MTTNDQDKFDLDEMTRTLLSYARVLEMLDPAYKQQMRENSMLLASKALERLTGSLQGKYHEDESQFGRKPPPWQISLVNPNEKGFLAYGTGWFLYEMEQR